jgi:hypothetical protein
METALWIDENRVCVEEAVSVLDEYMSVPSAVRLLYRHRTPVAQTGPLVEDVEEDVEATPGVRAHHAYMVPSVQRPGWQVLRGSPPPAPAPAQTSLVQVLPEPQRVVRGMAWNKVVQLEAVAVEAVAVAVEEEVEEVWGPSQAYQDAVFDDETYNNELLLEVLEEVREVARRHDACHGVHSQAFVDALGNCVGA